ncbi:MAG TPA: restriction endonuclease [Planctomycetaceae bacterium]|nr:restriction endonuclease [Planctomycetaceae bacterium]
MSDKYASDFPLPGGVEQYFETLIALLRRVANEPLSHEQLTDVVTEVCPNASKSVAIGQYLGAVTRMGFWAAKDGLYRLTPDGHSLLEIADVDGAAARLKVIDIKLRDVIGYPELLQRLSEGTTTFDQLDAYMKQRLQTGWTSRNQAAFRLGWLRSLGYVVKTDHDFALTEAGRSLVASLGSALREPDIDPPMKPVDTVGPPETESRLVAEATKIVEQVQKSAVVGGTGVEFEQATAAAFKLLGFQVECIGGSGNPDIIATAVMGLQSYRVLIEAKSRTNGIVTQNDVNFFAVKEHKQKSAADYAVVFANGFSGGNLEKWASDENVRLLRVEELQQVLLSHAESVIPLYSLRDLFIGRGKTGEDVLSSLQAESETSSQRVELCRLVYDAILAHQTEEAALNEHSLFFILKSAHSIQSIRETTEILRSGLIPAIERPPEGSLYCRLAPQMLAARLNQISDVIGRNLPT